jgi:membrane-bound lytic murein transglycosylase D
MRATLVHHSGSREGRKDRIREETTKLGRKPDNDIVFDENVVSSYHAEIRQSHGSFSLLDLGSTNGTFVNGESVEKIRLNHRDRVEIGKGGPVFEFRTDEGHTDRGPCIIPVSGAWENKEIINLDSDIIALGRGQGNDIVVGRTHSSVVSSRHAEIRIVDDSCEIEDLDSANGLFVNERQVRRTHLYDGDRVELGSGGPVFEFRWHEYARHERGKADKGMLRKIERAAKGGPAGDQTKMFLKVARKYHRHHRRPYVVISLVVLVIAAAAFSAAVFYFRRAERLNMMNNFYEVRRLEADLLSKPKASEQEKQGLRAKRRKLEDEYDKYLEKVGWYVGKSQQQRAVMKMARRLGEADLDIPEGFYETVMEYVASVKKTSRLRNAVRRARSEKILSMINQQLVERDLPLEFLYIAFQESTFNSKEVGIPTRFGIAKGMWQLIPPTAAQYGLEVGPDKDKPVFDASDMRHDAIRSTQAATNFLKDLYATKAAASGLLVMASYNYGPSRITKNLDELPNDPKIRSFWHFYRNNWLPSETREYVFSIIAAALICENPSLFGYDLGPNPSTQ